MNKSIYSLPSNAIAVWHNAAVNWDHMMQPCQVDHLLVVARSQVIASHS